MRITVCSQVRMERNFLNITLRPLLKWMYTLTHPHVLAWGASQMVLCVCVCVYIYIYYIYILYIIYYIILYYIIIYIYILYMILYIMVYYSNLYYIIVYILYSPGKNTGVGSHSLLQGIFPTQGLNPRLLHLRQILYSLSHQESPFIYYIYYYIKSAILLTGKAKLHDKQIPLQKEDTMDEHFIELSDVLNFFLHLLRVLTHLS